VTASDHLGERQHAPGIAARAVGRERVPVLEQARNKSQVDHGLMVTPGLAHRASRPYVKRRKSLHMAWSECLYTQRTPNKKQGPRQ